MTSHCVRGNSPSLLLIALMLCASSPAFAGPVQYPGFSSQTAAVLARGDTTLLLHALDNRLSNDENDHRARLDRGWLYLVMDNRQQADKDFMNALGSSSDSIRISAYCGLAWCSLVPGRQRKESDDYVRRALAVDENSAEALYTKTIFMLSGDVTTDDVRIAKRALFQLLEADFGYRDTYRLWRDVVLDRTDAEIRRVNELLAAYLESHPDSAFWRLDLAWGRYLVEDAGAALEELAKLAADNPEFSHPDRHLLDARCRLETGDTVAFHDLYWKAVDLAGATGQFERLIADAATIFRPKDKTMCEQKIAAGNQQEFLHFFWTDIDPVKLHPINLRLAEHYFRLGYAQRNYRLSQPHNNFNTNLNANRLLGFQGVLLEHKSEVISFSGGNSSGLDHRGLLYMRFGPPDNGQSHLPNDNSKITHANLNQLVSYPSNPLEIWYYDDIPFVFEKLPMAGGYISRPLEIAGVEAYLQNRGGLPNISPPPTGDMQKAMTRQRFNPIFINESVNYYVAQFAAPDFAGVEVEIYQDEEFPENTAPSDAEAAAYDTLWNEYDRRKSSYFRIPGERENRWVAVHTIPFPPGEAKYAISLSADGKSWNGRGDLDLPSFSSGYLELSAVVLGLDPPPDGPSHERRGVRFIPRPSFRFQRGEQIRVYLELNNLANGPERSKSYREYIDVLRYEGEGGVLGRISSALAGLLTFGEEKEGAAIRLKFDREVPAGDGPVAESFLVDSSELTPGKYRLLIEARDNVNLFWDDEAVMFEIAD